MLCPKALTVCGCCGGGVETGVTLPLHGSSVVLREHQENQKTSQQIGGGKRVVREILAGTLEIEPQNARLRQLATVRQQKGISYDGFLCNG